MTYELKLIKEHYQIDVEMFGQVKALERLSWHINREYNDCLHRAKNLRTPSYVRDYIDILLFMKEIGFITHNQMLTRWKRFNKSI